MYCALMSVPVPFKAHFNTSHTPVCTMDRIFVQTDAWDRSLKPFGFVARAKKPPSSASPEIILNFRGKNSETTSSTSPTNSGPRTSTPTPSGTFATPSSSPGCFRAFNTQLSIEENCISPIYGPNGERCSKRRT